jgi:hypothetical protein
MANLLDVIKQGAELAPAVMRGPDSDWTPVLMYEDRNGTVHPTAFPGMTPETLPEAAKKMENVMRKAGAVQAALVLPTYFTPFAGGDKVERVLVTHVDRDGTRCEAAKVIRKGTFPPQLGRWDVYYQDSDVGPGVFVDAMRAAIG